MTILPVISGRECIKALQKAGFYISRQKGSHVTMRRDEPKGRAIVPMHKTLKTGTLRSIIKQAGLTVDEFVRLLD
jgi:predicted RNA binding protein YcfA (HicA-like mRNA interferase family)